MSELDLRIAKDARKFLSDIKVDGKLVTEFTLSNGRTLQISELTDEQVILYANEIYFELFNAKDGGQEIDTHIWTDTN